MGNVLIDNLIGRLYGDPVKSELSYRNVYKYLDKYMSQLGKQTYTEKQNASVKENKTIWILWLQGMEHAPKLIRRCYESVERNKPDDFDIVLLTSENIHQYVDFPSYIWEKYEKGIITKTHFSDILRAALLCDYGGCWIDATVYCSEKIPDYMLNGEIFFFRGSLHNKSVLKGSSWWIYSRKKQPLMCDLKELLYIYWEKENVLRAYYLIHIMLSKLIDVNASHKKVFQQMLYVNNSNSHVLYKELSSKYNAEKWGTIKSISLVHKLSYKKKYILGDLDTFYMALTGNRLL